MRAGGRLRCRDLPCWRWHCRPRRSRGSLCPDAAVRDTSIGIDALAASLPEGQRGSYRRDDCSVTKGGSVDVCAELSLLVRSESQREVLPYRCLGPSRL